MAKKIPAKYQIWIDAKKRFHLSDAQIQMARELGMNPKKFGKLDNSDQEQWKAPLPQFIERIYFKRFGKERPDVVRSIQQIVKDENRKKQERREQKKARQGLAADIVTEVKDELVVQVKSLIDSILKIPGKKILTLVTEHPAPFVIDVSEAGVFGYEKAHELLFKARLFSAFASVGGLTIRQFLPVKLEREMPNGQKIWIPKKNIYGVQIVSGKWIPLPKSEVESAHCTDYRTGQPIPPEADVFFCDFPM